MDMKKILSLILILAILPVIQIRAKSEHDFSAYTVVEGEEVYRQDFEGAVEKEFTPDSRFVISRGKNGTKALKINGASANIATGVIGPDIDNFVLEADVMQLSCNGSTNASFFVGVRNKLQGAPEGYRFFYSDINRVNLEQGDLTAAESVRDRIGIAKSSGSHNMGTWSYGAMSEQPTSLLDLTSRSFSNYVHIKLIVSDIFLRMEVYNKEGNLISVCEQSTKKVDRIPKSNVYKDMLKSGGFLIGSHSADLSVDNIVIKKAGIAQSVKFQAGSAIMLTGAEYALSLVSQDGQIVPAAPFEWVYDATAMEIKDGKIYPKKAGNYTIKANYKGKLSDQIEIVFADTYPFEDFSVELDSSTCFAGSPIAVSISGVIDNITYQTKKDLQIITDAGVVEDNVIHTSRAGRHSVVVGYRGMQKEVLLYVSHITSAKILFSNDTIQVGSGAAFQVFVTEDEIERELTSADFTVSFDDGIDIKDNSIFAQTTGNKNITVTVDQVSVTSFIKVIEKSEGIIFYEDFESDKRSEFFPVEDKYLYEDGINSVMKLTDEFSPYFGRDGWRNYTISGRVKIVDFMMNSRRMNTSFGIYLRRTVPTPDISGGNKGIPFVYCMDEGVGDYLRIGTQEGANVSITDGEWYDFSVTAHENQFIFTLADQSIYYTYPEKNYGGFEFAANNCSLYLDDISVTKHANKMKNFTPASMELLKKEHEIDIYSYSNINTISAVKITNQEGYAEYANKENTKWTVINGKATISTTGKISFSKDILPGEKAFIQCTYGDLSDTLTITAVKGYDSKIAFLKKTGNYRKTNFMYKLLYSAEMGVALDNSKLYFLSYMASYMLMYPTKHNYDRELKWLPELADFETATKGAAVGGGDFVNNVMLILKNEAQGVLNASDEAWKEIDHFIAREVYVSYGVSENHVLVYYTNAILGAELLPDTPMFNGKKGEEFKAEYTRYLVDWINYRYKRGMLEYDSTYLGIDFIALETFYRYTKDNALRKMVGDFLDYLYTDMMQDVIEDRQGGAHGRTYFNTDTISKMNIISQKFDTQNERTDETTIGVGAQPAIYAISDFLPSDIVMKISLDDTAFVNKERRAVHHLPQDEKITESLKKYTYSTSDYVMGSIQNYENPFGGLVLTGDKYYKKTGTYPTETWVAGGHQEIPMSIMFKGNDRSFLTYGHPGPAGYTDIQGKHAYFSGFYNYPAFNFLQYKNTMICTYYIDNPDHLQYTHWYIPKKAFDQVDEEDGWIFIKYGDVYTAIKPLKDGAVNNTPQYRWGDNVEITVSKINLSQSEVMIESKYSASIMQVVNKDEYNGTYEEFKAEMKKLPITYSLEKNGTLKFTNLYGDTLKSTYDDKKHIVNGETIDYTQYKLQDSPYASADWLMGYIRLNYQGEQKVITPARVPLDKKGIAALSNEIKNMSKAMMKNQNLSLKTRLELLWIDEKIEKIIVCSDEYVQKILWEQLIKSANDIMVLAHRSNNSTNELFAALLKKIEYYIAIPECSEYAKQLKQIIEKE